MTGEEMERAIEFLLDNQARIEARMSAGFEETSRQIAETNQLLDAFADTQAELMRVATETFTAQNRINEDMRLGVEQLRISQEAAWEAIRRLSDRQNRTEASVERLAETVHRHLEGGDGNARG